MTESGSRCAAIAGAIDMVDARFQVQRQMFTRHEEILVVDGECWRIVVGLGFSPRHRTQTQPEQQQFFHSSSPCTVERTRRWRELAENRVVTMWGNGNRKVTLKETDRCKPS